MKRGQVTPFVIIGLVILIIAGLFLIYGDSFVIPSLKDVSLDEEVRGINDRI